MDKPMSNIIQARTLGIYLLIISMTTRGALFGQLATATGDFCIVIEYRIY